MPTEIYLLMVYLIFQKSGVSKLKLLLNSNKEPISDWINSDKTFGASTVKLKGEKINGNAILCSIKNRH